MSSHHATAWMLCYLEIASTKQFSPLLFNLTLFKWPERDGTSQMCLPKQNMKASSLVPCRVLFPWIFVSIIFTSAFLPGLPCFPTRWPLNSLLYSRVFLAHRSRLFQLLPNHTSSQSNKLHSQWHFCVFITLSHCYDNPSLREEEFILAHGLRVPPIMAGKEWQWDCEADGHIDYVYNQEIDDR